MEAESDTNYDNGRVDCESRSSIREVPQEREDEQMKDVIESRFEFDKAIGAGLAKEINALYNDGGHGRLTLPIGVCSAPSCWSPWAVSADRRHLQGVELSGEEFGNLDGRRRQSTLRTSSHLPASRPHTRTCNPARQRDPYRARRVLALPQAQGRANPRQRDKRWRERVP